MQKLVEVLRPKKSQFLFLFLTFYLRESQRAGERVGEADSLLSWEPGAGLDPRTLRS